MNLIGTLQKSRFWRVKVNPNDRVWGLGFNVGPLNGGRRFQNSDFDDRMMFWWLSDQTGFRVL